MKNFSELQGHARKDCKNQPDCSQGTGQLLYQKIFCRWNHFEMLLTFYRSLFNEAFKDCAKRRIFLFVSNGEYEKQAVCW